MQASMPKIVVVGATYIEMLAKCNQMPMPGQNLAGSAISYTLAGPGPNEAAQAALCRCQVHLISKVGGDCFAKLVKDNLAEFNIDSSFLGTTEAKYTGAIITIVDSKGENASLKYAGANTAILPQDIDAAEQLFANADLCLIHGALPQETVIQAIRCAKLQATKIVLNPAVPLTASSAEGTTLQELPIEYFDVDVLIPNLYEAAQITERGAANIRTAKMIGSELVARGVKTAVITMGKRGCMVVDRDDASHIPAFDIELVDQTGTGDAFAGALAASLAVGDNINDAVKFASAAGALVCTKIGAIDALPKKAEIIQLLQREE